MPEVKLRCEDMRILVVDDEDCRPIAHLHPILTHQGYQTIAASSGVEALEVARQHPCDLVITDIRMPGMDGRELVQRLKEEQYPARYLLLSGYTESGSDDLPFLAKPFEAHRLIETGTHSRKAQPQPGRDSATHATAPERVACCHG